MPGTLVYLHDPLCGWCYGATAALDTLQREAPQWRLRPLPTGLFAGDPQRRLDPAMEAHIWQADQRIAAMSGMPFSEAYRQQVLRDPASGFDSGPATLARTAVAGSPSAAHERAALKAIQHARWVLGQDITLPGVLADALALATGEPQAAWLERLADPQLPAAAQERLQRAASLMRRFGFQGVPALLVLPGEASVEDEASLAERALQAGRPLRGNVLFDGSLVQALQALEAAAAA
jgi:putative protein-disulfide isomerase